MGETGRYERTSGKWWGAKFENLCRGHRLYILKPRAGPDERIDLHTSPGGDAVGEPVDHTECTLCRKSANNHGEGLHGVSVYGCPLCGGDVESRQSRGSGGVLNYNECPDCSPDPLTVRFARWLLGLF